MKNLIKIFDDLEFIETVGYMLMFTLLFASLIMFLARV